MDGKMRRGYARRIETPATRNVRIRASNALRCRWKSLAGGLLTASPKNGLVHLAGSRSAPETMSVLEAAVRGRGLSIAAPIDHSADAAKAGLPMPPTELPIFGNPTPGMPLMVVSPTAAIDLPLKAPVWLDADGHVWLSYNTPAYLQERHGIPNELLKSIGGIASICEEAVR